MKPKIFLLLATLPALLFTACQQTAVPPPAHAGLKLGVQAWTYKQFTFAETVEKVSRLGVRYLQAYSGQTIGGGIEGTMVPAMDEATRAKVLALLQAKNVTLTSFGVARPKTEAQWRELFAFAKAMGLRDVTVEPPKAAWPGTLPLLDRFSREYGVNVTIHNHPNPENPPEDLVAALKPYGPHLGFCADTGHWARSGFDPVAALHKAEGRLLSLHFKDLSEITRKAHDVPWGTGASNAAGQIAELRRQRFAGIAYVEYEYRTPSLEADVARSVEFFRRAAAASEADLIAGRVVPPGFTDDVSQVWSKTQASGAVQGPSSSAARQP